MSKVDAQRAMREARFERARARGKQTAAARTPVAATSAPSATAAAPEPAPEVAASAVDGSPAPDALCGHQGMGGRTCTRPAGHPQKNHRYAPTS